MQKFALCLTFVASLCLSSLPFAQAANGPLEIVKDGQPRAEIVVAEKRARMTTLAALELQHFLEKMSGARLPIVTAATSAQPIKIYVGMSPGTEKLGITDKGLKYGAFRIVSGPDWLVLVGNDADFVPHPSISTSRKNNEEEKKLWDAMTKGKTDAAWNYPFNGVSKRFWTPNNFEDILAAQYGDGAVELWSSGGSGKGFWMFDSSGSINAVAALLQNLGVRWFKAGEANEIVPASKTISVGPIDETSKPDYALRSWDYYNYATFSFDDVIWARRLGMDESYEKIGLFAGPHGMVHVHADPKMQEMYPEYYALISGERDTGHRGRGTPNFTSEGLTKEAVNYVNFIIETYNPPMVDLWPVDGLQLSQDEDSQGKTMSDLVWGFVDRVAREVYKKHPDVIITCGAYANYSAPPDSIKKFSPNVGVWISNAGRPNMDDPEFWDRYMKRLDGWKSRVTPGHIFRLENSRYHVFGAAAPINFPVIHPHAVAKELHALKGISQGDRGEQSQRHGKWVAPGIEHLTLYVQSKFLWNANQNVDEILDEYFTEFYGPAAEPMKKAITFAEQNYARDDQSRGRGRGTPRNVPLEEALKLRDLLDTARKAAGDTVYGERVQTVISELQPREELIAETKAKKDALAQSRLNVPQAIGTEGADLSKATVYTLVDNKTGKPTTPETTFRAGWDKNDLVLDIVCKEPDMKNLQSSSDVHSGDYIAITIETPEKSYYILEITPDGVVVDGDPGPRRWKSLAQIKTEKGPDSWSMQVRIPTVGSEEAAADPNHRVAGVKPTKEAPWFINVGRKRSISTGDELQAFSPTGAGWHKAEKFGKFIIE